MGYETTLIVIESWKKDFKGYCSIVASLELCKVGYNGAFAALLDKSKIHNEHDEKKANQYETDYKGLWDNEGGWHPRFDDVDKDVREQEYANISAVSQYLESKYPCIYWGDNNCSKFTDEHGDLLMLATLQDVKKAIQLQQKEYDSEYWRFKIAISMLNSFIKNGQSDQLRVVLYGH